MNLKTCSVWKCMLRREKIERIYIVKEIAIIPQRQSVWSVDGIGIMSDF